MSSKTDNPSAPFANSNLARFIARRLVGLNTTQLQSMAQAAGYETAAILQSIGRGEARVQLDRAADLSAALGCSVGLVLGLGCGDHWSSDLVAIFAGLFPERAKSDADFEVPKTSADKRGEPPRAHLQSTTVFSSRNDEDAGGSQEEIFNLNFKVTRAFHRNFRLEAAERELSMKGLLEECVRAFLALHGARADW